MLKRCKETNDLEILFFIFGILKLLRFLHLEFRVFSK